MSKKTILVADDEPDVLETLSYRLSRAGYTVVTATDGVEALGAARAHLPDLALLDVMLAGDEPASAGRSPQPSDSLRAHPLARSP